METADYAVAPQFWPVVEGWHDHRFFGLPSGRAAGKSYFVADALLAEGQNEPHRILCVREVQRSIADSVHQLMVDRLEEHGWTPWWDILKDSLTCSYTGTTVRFRGLSGVTAASLKSFEGSTRAWAEEAQALTARSLSILIPTIRRPGSKLFFTWNPENEDDAVHAMFDDPPPRSLRVPSSYADNPWLADDVREHAADLQRKDPEEYEHVYGGACRSRQDRLIFRRGVHWDIAPYEPGQHDGLPPLLGADFGAADPTVLVEVRVDAAKRHLRIGRMDYARHLRLSDIPDRWRHATPCARSHEIRADSAALQIIQSLRGTFPNIVSAIKGPNSIAQGLEFLKDWMMLIDPSLTDLTTELSRYGYKVDPRTDLPTSVIEDDWNHAIDAIRYAIEPLRMRSSVLNTPAPSVVAV